MNNLITNRTRNIPRISIIILNYNGMKYIENCLLSVLHSNYEDFEIIFVDNASSDESIGFVKKKFSSYKNLQLIINDKNYGFAFGNNLGARHTTGKYLLFLNIDTIVDSNCFIELVNVMEDNPLVGAAQCKLLLMDDSKLIDSVGHYIDWFGISFVRGHLKEDQNQYNKKEKIFSATGAAIIVRKDIFEKLKGFDDDYFMLFEEDDLCWRIWIAGYEVLYIPEAVVLHKSGALRSMKGNYINLYYSRRNRMISLLKNYNIKNLIRLLPISISLLFAISFLTKNKKDYLNAFVRSLIWIIHNLKRITIKRIFTQKTRKISDEQLMKKNIIARPSIKKMLIEGY